MNLLWPNLSVDKSRPRFDYEGILKIGVLLAVYHERSRVLEKVVSKLFLISRMDTSPTWVLHLFNALDVKLDSTQCVS